MLRRSLSLCVLTLVVAALGLGFTLNTTATVRGTISDGATGEPLIGAQVMLRDTRNNQFVAGMQADLDGRYRLEEIRPGTYELVVRYIGFEELRVPTTLVAGEQQTRHLTLAPRGRRGA